MADADLDFMFGWRWLLPVAAGDARSGLHGFPREEELFLRHTFPGPGQDTASKRADVLLVDAVRCAPQNMPASGDIQAAQVVCVLANRAQGKRWRAILRAAFPTIREYALLPTATPRVVVPLSSPRHAVAALGLHRPGRWRARAGIILARMLAAAGGYFLLRGRVLLIAFRSDDFVPMGSLPARLFERYGDGFKDFALYLGAPGDNRKTVVLPLGESAPGVILKVASTLGARASLNNEAAALSALSSSPLAVSVPRLLGQVSTDGALTLYQEYRPRRQIRQRRLDAAVVSFLGRLAALSRKSASLSELLAGLPADAIGSPLNGVDAACRSLRGRLQQMGESGGVIWVHRTHGDFAPWNCAWSEKGLFVFDWEESRADGPALSDAFYYAIAPVLLVQRNASATRTLKAALHLAARVADASHAKVDVRVYLALWLLGRVGQAGLYDALILQLDRSWQ